ncbi:MAG: S9 family peptidase [Rhizobiaceae bacterium]
MPFATTDAAPRAAKRPVTHTVHGIERIDEYAWLRADNWQAVFRDTSVLDPEIRAHLDAENLYQHALMNDTEALRSALFAEMKGRIKEDDASVPMKDGSFAYGVSYVTGGQYPRYFRMPRDGGAQTVFLDGDIEGAGKAYFSLGGVSHSHDHKQFIWSCDDAGSEYYTIRVRNFATGKDLDDVVENTGGGGVFDAEATGLFYTELDENHRPVAVRYHRLGSPNAIDAVIYAEADPGFFMDVHGSMLNDFIFISINDHETSEIRLIPADTPLAEPKIVAARQAGIQYSLAEAGNRFYVLTNMDAKDFKICEAPVADPAMANWKEVVPHRPGCLILSASAYRDHMVRLEREDGLPRIIVHDRKTGEEHAIGFAEEAYSLGLQGAGEYDTDVIRFTYSSMTTPSQTYDYNMRTRERTLLKTQEVPSGHNADDYVTRRVMAQGHDGEQVPVSLVYRKSTPLDGTAPLLLYGYGAYGISIPAGFNTNILSLVDRGFVYAIAHIRGGKERGYRWYDAGKREHKTNTFKDFVAAADYLIQGRFCAPGRIVAHGGSAGGMLMGAVANMAPHLFCGIIAEVPFVDVLSTILDDTLPLTPPEWPEWGNPIISIDDYKTIASYSPYDNVQALHYPPILAIAGLTDPRVTYWEPAKWVARLRDYTTSSHPVLMKTNMAAGHGGASGRFSRLEEVAYSYAFAIKAAGLPLV